MTAKDQARYVLIPIALVATPIGVYNAATGDALFGALEAVVGVAAAAEAIYKLTRQ